MFFRKQLLMLIFSSLFLFSPSTAFSHEGHAHPEASEEAKILQTTPTTVEKQPAKQIWIPVVAVVGGIATGSLGILLLHTKLHPKKK
jgi:hypothetical protein